MTPDPCPVAMHAEGVAGELLRALASTLSLSFIVRGAGGPVLTASPDGSPPIDGSRTFQAPIELAGEPVGTLAASPCPPGLRPLVRSLASDISGRLDAAVETDCMVDRLAQCYDEIELLCRMSASLRPDVSFVEQSRRLAAETIPHMRGATMGLYLRKSNNLSFWTDGEPRPAIEATEAMADAYRSIVEDVRSDEPVRGPGAQRLTRRRGRIEGPDGTVRYVGFAIRERDDAVGFVCLHHESPHEPPETGELKILECLANQLADTATRSALVEEVRSVLFNTVKSLVAAVDAKDTYTRGHSERVYRLSTRIGEMMHLEAEELQTLSWSALLHDIGKIAVPEGILKKPDGLTDNEFRMIQTHPVRGVKMLEPITQLRDILPGIRSHHERIDGRGYPDRLSGDQIPLMARIIAVADSYDALVSTRAYRQARTPEFALKEIQRAAGTQLDPRIVELLLALAADGELELPASTDDDEPSSGSLPDAA